ncbi:UNVERIFIED_CONTAM: hypothetical protein FKN15_023193 [Acipenser sinensis]
MGNGHKQEGKARDLTTGEVPRHNSNPARCLHRGTDTGHTLQRNGHRRGGGGRRLNHRGSHPDQSPAQHETSKPGLSADFSRHLFRITREGPGSPRPDSRPPSRSHTRPTLLLHPPGTFSASYRGVGPGSPRPDSSPQGRTPDRGYFYTLPP